MIFIQSLKYRYVHLLSLGSVLLLQDLLDDLLLLNQECTDDSLTHASSAARTTIGTGDVLLTLGDAGILLGPQVGNLRRMVKLVRRSRNGALEEKMQRFGMTYTGEGDTAVAALGAVSLLLGVLEGEAATRGLHNTGGVGGGLVRVPAAVGKALHL